MNKHSTPSRTTAFTTRNALPKTLSAPTAASLLSAAGDVSLILTGDGTILDIAVSQPELANHGFGDWIGESWIDTMTIESRPKAVEMLAAAAKAEPARWRQVNHPAVGDDLPVRYLVMPLGEKDRLIAIGRDMRAQAAMQQRLLQTQQSLERDYIRLRQAETRYRMLFDMASGPVMIVDAQDRRIREANPAAHLLLKTRAGTLIGAAANTILSSDQRDDFVGFLGAAAAGADVAPAMFRLRDGIGDATISARLFREAREPLLIVHIEPAIAGGAQHRFDAALADVVERMPDAFVLADRDLNILTANAAFIEMTEMPSADRVMGAPLANWLGRPGIDLELIVDQLSEHGAVRNVATIVRGLAAAQEEVEVSGVAASMDGHACYGLTIRSVARRLRDAPVATRGLPRSVDQLTGLVGRMSLKEIVRESTDMIERLCIEAALAYTSDNRASAAEVLGVSRQSLYSKLHRHGLGNLTAIDD